ncbi:MAG: LytTR family transcriptional regulator [Cyclobacteriaceae bacterium]
MRIIWHIIYWILVLLFLTLFFGQNWENHILAFYFSCLLLPIVVGTTYFFNMYLVPRYLITGRYWTLALYSFYMLVVSLYIEVLVALLSFIVIANYKLAVMSVMSTSVFVLGVILYLIVFVTSFIRLVIQFRKKSQQLESLENAEKRNKKTSITIRADRKNQQVALEELLYIESLDDYVKLVTETRELMTREKISKLHSSLPRRFVRIHRSFVINMEKVSSYTHERVMMNETALPIGRTYKKASLEQLQSP